MRRHGRGAGPFRRGFRRAAPLTVPPELRRANELMDSGQHADAALAFERIAERTAARSGARAPLFFLRAGRAYLLAGAAAKGIPLLKQGLSMIAVRRDWEPLQRFGQRTVGELNELGYISEAEEISAYLAATLPEYSAKFATAQNRADLPTHCPGCGAPLRTDEVEWLDEKTAECVYCGNPVRGDD